MSTEIQLIEAIEKHPCLYNFNLTEYNRKDITDEAWLTVSHNIDIAVSDCKEKWRNIRSSFLRSLKPGANKTKKPYYLSEFLQFLVPFLKPFNTDLSQQSLNDTSEQEIEIKQEIIDKEYDANQESCDVTITEETDDLAVNSRLPLMRKKKRQVLGYKPFPDQRFKMRRLLRPPTVPPRTELLQDTNSSNAMRYFLMSLLPEFDTMDEEQIRMFKIKVMMLINDLKTNPQKKDLPRSDLDRDRQQKRLINLLIKTLTKKT